MREFEQTDKYKLYIYIYIFQIKRKIMKQYKNLKRKKVPNNKEINSKGLYK